jgi:hypothetical protein
MKAGVHVPLFLTLAIEEVSGQTHNQALYASGKTSITTGWALELVPTCWKRLKISCFYQELRYRTEMLYLTLNHCIIQPSLTQDFLYSR